MQAEEASLLSPAAIVDGDVLAVPHDPRNKPRTMAEESVLARIAASSTLDDLPALTRDDLIAATKEVRQAIGHKPNLLPVSEIFGPTIQGEGSLIGTPTLFVRFGGCDYRCSWCDSLYAVLPKYRKEWRKLTAAAILDELQTLAPPPYLVTLSGGNPALHDLTELLDLGHARGYTFSLETQGSVSQRWFARLDHLTISPKPPSSGNETSFAPLLYSLIAANHVLRKPDPVGGVDMEFILRPPTTIKIVVFDDADYAYARRVFDVVRADSFDPPLEYVLSVGNSNVSQEEGPSQEQLTDRLQWLIDKVIADHWNVRVLPQLHVLLYGNRRGV